MESILSSFPGPWCGIGDFNDLLNQSEKYGGRPVVTNSNGGLNNFMNGHGLIDIAFLGASFTWSNKRRGKALIRERFDQGIVNQEWKMLFPDANLQNLITSASDHSPLLLSMTAHQSEPHSFNFEEFW
ncbi:hypothetical protein I3760_01G095400, partial [Carya illinoinensis]